jgi:membrane protein DedA with SNARE-associated domain
MMSDLLDWLAALPDVLLYGVIAIAAFAENVFPPLPADTVVALGAFVSARGSGSAVGAWAATMAGNIGGAMSMFTLGRRYGLPWLSRRIGSLGGPEAMEQVATRYRSSGTSALLVSRFLPGVRAVVPPLAGALGVSTLRALVAMSLASGVWYGVVCWLAFRAEAHADDVLAAIASRQREAAMLAALLLGAGLLAFLIRRHRSRRS